MACRIWKKTSNVRTHLASVQTRLAIFICHYIFGWSELLKAYLCQVFGLLWLFCEQEWKEGNCFTHLDMVVPGVLTLMRYLLRNSTKRKTERSAKGNVNVRTRIVRILLHPTLLIKALYVCCHIGGSRKAGTVFRHLTVKSSKITANLFNASVPTTRLFKCKHVSWMSAL